MAAIIGNRNITLGVMGGTLITAACYSGGEVFGCSPYDAATTAYLKATYPAYWQAIKQFGWDNPQLVPWINEDNDLIVSLVEVGKERWLKGDNVAYIKTGFIPNDHTGFKELIKAPTTRPSDSTPFGSRAYSDGRWWWNCSSGMECSMCTSQNVYGYALQEIMELEFNYKESDNGKLNGVVKRQFNGIRPTSYIECYMFTNNLSGSKGWMFQGWIAYVECTEYQNVVRKYVPCTHNGAAGMLDIVNAQWYGNANTSGAFTIEITDR